MVGGLQKARNSGGRLSRRKTCAGVTASRYTFSTVIKHGWAGDDCMTQSTLDQIMRSAVACHQAGRLVEADRLYRQVLARQPNHADALQYMGVLASQMGRHDLAVPLIQRAIQLRPDADGAYYNLGRVFVEQGKLDEAIDIWQKALRLRPDNAPALLNLGNALCQQGQIDAAIDAHRRAIVVNPRYADAHFNLGFALTRQGNFDQAIDAYRQAIKFEAAHAKAHRNLSHALLATGNFIEGFKEHEWRWKCDDFTSPARNFPQPQWAGEPIDGKTILLHCEQGFGDSIQFARYIPAVGDHGARVIVQCPRELARLLRPLRGVTQTVLTNDPLPPIDLHCPLMSLPWVMGTTSRSIPSSVPYLQVESGLVSAWRQKSELSGEGLKIGLVWAGSPDHKDDRNRSLDAAMLLPLFETPKTRFFSLQKSAGPVSIAGHTLVDFTVKLSDFADTAALILQLDLVISVDTAVAHLAGALGKPVWVMLPFAADWRWMLHRADSPWYPTMRLFRQSTSGDWSTVVNDVASALTSLSPSRPFLP